ncbi:hypothetical protein Tco_0860236 [Tanacetum coccineum]|uniref:Uncharacterized protein n=1 Tax=Tanacetum coccineum TaxID=301880 RepID=A0ABQ5BK09_9ASTR
MAMWVVSRDYESTLNAYGRGILANAFPPVLALAPAPERPRAIVLVQPVNPAQALGPAQQSPRDIVVIAQLAFIMEQCKINSAKCQIIHRRQGHKDECRPYVAVNPSVDVGSPFRQGGCKDINDGFNNKAKQHTTPLSEDLQHKANVRSDERGLTR